MSCSLHPPCLTGRQTVFFPPVLCFCPDMIMIVFVTVALGRCLAGLVERRTWLGGAAVLSVFAAALAAYGINNAFGEPPANLIFVASLLSASLRPLCLPLRLRLFLCLSAHAQESFSRSRPSLVVPSCFFSCFCSVSHETTRRRCCGPGLDLSLAPGVPFTSLSQILPFILVGIGVDDAFVIVGAYDHTDPTLPVEERVALCVKRCGVSITCKSSIVWRFDELRENNIRRSYHV